MAVSDTDPIVVTGMGAVTPLGVGVKTNWERLTAGRSGVRRNDRFDVSELACQIAGLVPPRAEDEHGFDVLDFVDPKDVKKMDLFIQYGLGAAQEALQQAGWKPETEADREATATIIASGVGGFPNMTASAITVKERGARRLSPFIVPSFLANLAAGWISIRHGFKGPLGTPVTACAAAAQAIGDGMRMIHTGEAEVAVVGGAEGSIDPVTIGGFSAARALATTFNDRPTEASRPFDKARDGFVLAEGAAVLVIEKLSHALKRGAEPLAVLAGYGTSADAYHLTASPPDGEGAQRAMRLALKMGGVSPADIGYVNAHSTSTQVGDAAEIAAVASVFANRGKELAISATKSATGHLLGAAGAIASIYTVMALRTGLLPATLNLDDPDESAAVFDLIAKTPKPKDVAYALVNAFGFGGVNASLLVGRV
ncbi:MAG TPA: beta-ketoacyl-ACP synthase II [Devosia sp.]|nr:beta-ketoacyl-ACP synthase II [Devosia sp.]